MKNVILMTLLLLLAFPAHAADAAKESTYDRIMRTGTIRCGYYAFKPATWTDQAGKLQGFSVDIWELLGKNMGLKVEWTEEVSFGTMYEGLKTGRYDAICSPDWPNANNARVAAFSAPVFYAPVYTYVRGDDTRFDNGDLRKLLNDGKIRLSVQDGAIEQHIAATRFPLAQQIAVAQASAATEVEMNVTSSKADATFLDTNRAKQFLEANPGALKKIGNDPVQVFPFKVAIPAEEYRFKNHLDIAIEEIINNGEMDRILNKYDPQGTLFLRVAQPYETPK